MLDIFGREVQRGDIIVYGSGSLSGGQTRWAETKLGIVCNIIPAGKKYKVKDNSVGNGKNKYLLDYQGNVVIGEGIAKVAFYPLFKHETNLSTSTLNKFKNGKPKRVVSLSTTFLRLTREDLNDEWKVVYDEARVAFKI